MARYGKEKIQEQISQIRRILVIKPDSTIPDVQGALARQKKPLKLDKDYVNKLIKKIRKERIYRLDRYTINKVLAEFQDEVEELKKRLWVIINSSDSSHRDRVSAVKELRNSSKELFDKMFDAGVFTKKIGEMEVKGKLDTKDINVISKALKYAGVSVTREHNKESGNEKGAC